MSPWQIEELGWNSKLPTSLSEAVQALQNIVESHALDALGQDFLKMYIEFKNLESSQAAEQTEEGRLEVMSKVF